MKFLTPCTSMALLAVVGTSGVPGCVYEINGYPPPNSPPRASNVEFPDPIMTAGQSLTVSGVESLFVDDDPLTLTATSSDTTVVTVSITGAIPDRFLELNELGVFSFEANAGLCAPGTTEFNTWLNGIVDARGPYCKESDAKVLEDLYDAAGGRNWRNSDGWLQTSVLDRWHGVSADDLGRVVTLDLIRNGLTGGLPADLGNLAEMTALRIGGNALSGPLPLPLTRLALVELHYADTGLCVPTDATFQTWLRGIASHEGTDVVCDHQSGRETIETMEPDPGQRQEPQ